MPTPTYTPLANITLGSSAASVTFSSISQAYRDLVLVMQPASNTGATNVSVRFNSDSGVNYNRVYMSGNGTSATSAADSLNRAQFGASSNIDLTFNYNAIVNIMDYSATDKHKTVLARSNHASNGLEAHAIRWANTAAITSIFVFPFSNSFASGSSFALYGIAA